MFRRPKAQFDPFECGRELNCSILSPEVAVADVGLVCRQEITHVKPIAALSGNVMGTVFSLTFRSIVMNSPKSSPSSPLYRFSSFLSSPTVVLLFAFTLTLAL